jgi:uncharacterized membrane protein
MNLDNNTRNYPDIMADFAARKQLLESVKTNNKPEISEPLENDINNVNDDNMNSMKTLLLLNKNLRTHIELSIAIYKKINNFDHYYINELFNNENTKNSE